MTDRLSFDFAMDVFTKKLVLFPSCLSQKNSVSILFVSIEVNRGQTMVTVFFFLDDFPLSKKNDDSFLGFIKKTSN